MKKGIEASKAAPPDIVVEGCLEMLSMVFLSKDQLVQSRIGMHVKGCLENELLPMQSRTVAKILVYMQRLQPNREHVQALLPHKIGPEVLPFGVSLHLINEQSLEQRRLPAFDGLFFLFSQN